MSLLHHLEELTVNECSSIDVIFNIDLGSSSSSSSCVVAEIEEDNISNLRSIKVEKCGELRQVWRVKGVLNDDLPILDFQNVECIAIEFCKSLRNIFMLTTSNFDMKALTKVILKGTYDWEENERDNSQIARPYEMVESSQVEEINVVAFPSYLIHTYRYLRSLDIYHFEKVEVVFEIESTNSRKLTTTPNNQQPLLFHLKDLNLSNMKSMAHVWKYDRNQFLISQQEQLSSSFPNFASITLRSCNHIKYLFSPLMAKLLSNLNSIGIHDCDAIEEVVSYIDNEYEEIATSISSHTNTTFFPHLDILDLSCLKSLKHIDALMVLVPTDPALLLLLAFMINSRLTAVAEIDLEHLITAMKDHLNIVFPFIQELRNRYNCRYKTSITDTIRADVNMMVNTATSVTYNWLRHRAL
ncbi:hypothetical protein L6452_08156 [Arctium lappa]|uniref:Uncharacterized protein n=1 Tax=Arctium lappa TaxID=4217 RepID=A0ACB9DGH2_ARCLA|nr:hypothetical protein L6452_08156 [Arctium lappa]